MKLAVVGRPVIDVRGSRAEFPRSQAQGILALDFFTADLLNGTKVYVLAVTLIWNQRHLMMVLREYEDFYNSRRPHRALDPAAPLRPLPDRITDFDHFRVRRHDHAGGVIHEYRQVA
jgi:hypothetical protein